MTKANMELPNGTKITIEGTPEEVSKAIQLMQGTAKSTNKKKSRPKKEKMGEEKNKEQKTINLEDVYGRLSKVYSISKEKIQDNIYLKENGTFKFNSMIGKTKTAKQKNCILMSAHILLMGFGEKTFESKQMSTICIQSVIDNSGLNTTIRDMKRQEYISKEGVRSLNNILREKGKQEAIKLIKELNK